MNRPTTKEAVLQTLRRVFPSLREKYGVERLAIYGSFAKGSQGETSDIDILVELSRPLGFGFIRLAADLEAALRRPVDLATFDSLKRSAAAPHRAHIARDIERTLVDV
ncbi:MAG TPA: nucleotidyltransferase family protein [Anaerolineales bacterium]